MTMTKKETIVLLGYLKIAYPNMFNDNDAEYTGNVWHEMLCDEEVSLARLALKKHIASSKYPPSIAEFLSLIETEKWAIYSENVFCTLDEDENPKSKLPDCFVPRSIARKPKQFELTAKQSITKIIEEKSYLLPEKETKQITLR